MYRFINDRKIRLMSIDTETKAHYEFNSSRMYEKNYQLFWITDNRNVHMSTGTETLPIKLPSCAHRPNFKNMKKNFQLFGITDDRNKY